MQANLARFTLHRLGLSALLLLLVLSFTFFFVHLAPGDPTSLFQDPRVGPEHARDLRRIWGLDRPLAEQYLVWLESVLLEGDWGSSYVHQRPVTEVIRARLPATVLLAGTALTLQFGLGLLIGVSAARRPDSATDHLLRSASLVFYSLPVFWTALMALLLLSYKWSLFPSGHMLSIGADVLSWQDRLGDLLYHLALPVAVLTVAGAGAVARFTRNSMLEVLGADYIRTARAKGLPERRVIWVHALRNAATPLVQLLGLSLPFLLSGSLVIEVVFSWPGLGRLMYDSILARDYPVILAATALSGALVIAGNLLADLLQFVVDPRVRQ